MIKALLLALSIWVSQHIGLPMPRDLPVLHLMTEDGMCEIVKAKNCENIRALYIEGVIYMRTSFDPASLKDMSLLVHEIVHHHQHVNNVRYVCVGKSEPLAYRTQARWLMAAGVKDPWKLMETDEFTAISYAACDDM